MSPTRVARHLTGRWGAPPPMHFHVLLLLLFSLIALQPISSLDLLGVRLGHILVLLVLVGCVLAVRGWRLVFPLAALLAGAGVVVTLNGMWSGGDERIDVVADVLVVALLSLVSVCLSIQLFAEREVGLDSISAALCIYMLLGLAFAFVHDVLDQLDPGCIAGVDEAVVSVGDRLGALMYYSFVTLTTLGYGDMVPLSPAARNFAVLEALLGQVVLVVLVARLVGLQVAGGAPGGRPPDEGAAGPS